MATKKSDPGSGNVFSFANKKVIKQKDSPDTPEVVGVEIIGPSGQVIFEGKANCIMGDDDFKCVAIDVVIADGVVESHIFVLGQSFLLHIKPVK